MPLSELVYRVAKGKVDAFTEKNPTRSTDQSFLTVNDFDELVWENGQIQSNRRRKIETCNTLPSQTPQNRDKDMGKGTYIKRGKFGMESANEIAMSVPSIEMGLNKDADMVPWLNYTIDESLQHDYCSDFLPELSGVTVNEHSFQNNLASFGKRSGNPSIRDTHNVSVPKSLNLEQGNVPKVSSSGSDEVMRRRISDTQLYSSPPQECQTSFPYFRSRVLANSGDGISNATQLTASKDSAQVLNSEGGYPSIKMKQVPVPSTNNSNLMNFSYFSRPAALVKANLQNIGGRTGSGISNIERMGSKDKCSIAGSSNFGKFMHVDSCNSLRKDKSSHSHPIMTSSMVDAKPVEAKPADEPVPAEPPDDDSQEDESKNEKNCCQDFGGGANKGLVDVGKTIEPVVASSSVCSGNSVERASGDSTLDLKRKHRDAEESEGPSEDVEEESVGVKKATSTRGGTGCKRSRAAEVHNLSERRRRDRINEKMRALQELIPNCNKVDKASMLDEAIEYLKTLQLQVQIMSMGAGLYMPSMMLPPGMPHLHPAHMGQFSPMGVGIGMGMGFGMGMPQMSGGSSGCSMIQMPSIHGAHFPAPPMSGPSALHGMGGSNLQSFGLSGQGLPMSFPRAPLIPVSGGPPTKTNMGLNACGVIGPMDNLDSAPASSSKDIIQNIKPQVMQQTGANGSSNQTSSQCAATKECFEQSDLVQNNGQAPEVTDSGALKSANGNDNVPTGGVAGCD